MWVGVPECHIQFAYSIAPLVVRIWCHIARMCVCVGLVIREMYILDLVGHCLAMCPYEYLCAGRINRQITGRTNSLDAFHSGFECLVSGLDMSAEDSFENIYFSIATYASKCLNNTVTHNVFAQAEASNKMCVNESVFLYEQYDLL